MWYMDAGITTTVNTVINDVRECIKTMLNDLFGMGGTTKNVSCPV